MKNGGCRIESEKTLGVGLKVQSRGEGLKVKKRGCGLESEEQRV